MLMAGVAQLVIAPVCGIGCRRFKSGHSPHHLLIIVICLLSSFITIKIKNSKNNENLATI